ncbi:organic hydroperoxide resistance protein [Dyadobacter sp. CY343]|uniref:organic hydroperoxide resistance protein n=1 Tax=Dyadobacter sp. CY343 TaxID=2907299 RepID=UPI001F1FA626|nr:organic hydroperoxide resistance protein [Dyadobacter sp. CY343]MCE7059818.1 organic hydroperoxide resistance protein [Dyadobacter sp. CY343]
MKIEPVYTAKATATGGRNGKVKSENGVLDIDVRVPKEMGGPSGEYLNPEMLFAGGYAACFDSALSLIMRQEKITGVTTSVTAAVSIGKIENGGFGLSVVLEIEAPGLEKEQTEELVKKAHQVCPYSNATRGNVDVELIVK